VVAENSSFLGKLLFCGFPFFVTEIYIMIGILSFLLLFYLLCNAVLAQLVPEVPPPIVPEEVGVNELVDFSGIFDTLLEVFASFFVQYYGYLIGLFIASLFWAYIQGVLEGKKERLLRKQAVQKEINRAEDKRSLRERELIKKYAHVDDEGVARIQWRMRQGVEYDGKELGLMPEDSYYRSQIRNVFRFSGRVDRIEYDDGIFPEVATAETGGRGTTYWRADGTEEQGKIPGVSTVKDYRNRIHRGMDGDEYSGY
jgi:hypothetical protein